MNLSNLKLSDLRRRIISQTKLSESSLTQKAMVLLDSSFLVLVNSNRDPEVFVNDEHVVLGNDILVKCEVPAYEADFLDVIGWKVVHHLNKTSKRVMDVMQSLDYGTL